MEEEKNYPCGFLRFFKKDGSEGSVLPLQANEEYTIGHDPQASIRLKTLKSTVKPIQCIVKVDANGFAKLINKDFAHTTKLNSKALYGSKYLLPNDTFLVLDKQIRYENEHVNKNSLTKVSSKMNTPLKSTLSTRTVKGRMSYIDMKRQSTNMLQEELAFKSLKGSKTPHVKTQLEIEMQSPRSIQHRRLSSRLRKSNKNPAFYYTLPSMGNEESQAGICVSSFASNLKDLNTPPNNKSVVETNLTPYPSAKKRKLQKLVATDDLELADAKTPKTSSTSRNSLHLLTNKDRRSMLASISEFENITANNTPVKNLRQSFKISPDKESPVALSTLKRRSSTIGSIINRRNSTIKLNETYSEEEFPTVKEREAAMDISGIKLNETYSESNDQNSFSDGDLPSVTKQKQTPNTTKLNETFSGDDFLIRVHKPVARKSLKKLNKTISNADFAFNREQFYTPAIGKRRFSSFLETAVASNQQSITPSFSKNILRPSLSTKRKSLVTENLLFAASPHLPTNNITVRRPLKNLTSTYRPSRENIALTDSELERSQNNAKDTLNLTSQENRFSNLRERKTKSIKSTDSMSKDILSPFVTNKSFEVYHSSPMVKRRLTRTKSMGTCSFINFSPQLQHSEAEFNSLAQEEPTDLDMEESFSVIPEEGNNNGSRLETQVYSCNEDDSSEQSSLVKQLTLMLSDEQIDQETMVEDGHASRRSSKNKKSNSSSVKEAVSCNSSLGSDRIGSSLGTTRSSSFYYYEQPSSSFMHVNNTFSDLPNISPDSEINNERRTTSKPDLSDLGVENLSSASNHQHSHLVVKGKNLMNTPEVNKNTSSNANTPHGPKNDQVRDIRKSLITPKTERSSLNDSTQAKELKKTSKIIKSPKNNLSDLKGVRRVMIQKSPLNDITDVKGIARLMKTPKVHRSPKNDLSDVAGVRKLMASPRERKQPENDLSDVRGIKRLMSTPKVIRSPKNDLTNIAGVRKLMATPREQKQPENDLSDVRGIKRLMRTPKVIRSPKNDLSDFAGVKKLMATPREQKQPKNDLSDVRGMKMLLRTPRVTRSPKNDLSDVAGVRKLMETPRAQKQPRNDLSDVKGIKRLMRTPKAIKSPKNDLNNIVGVKKLMKTPRRCRSPKNDLSDFVGVRQLMSSPTVRLSPLNDLTDIEGLNRSLKTPKKMKSTSNGQSPTRGKSTDSIVFSTPNKSLDKSNINSTFSDFDVLLNKKPLRTYRAKSQSPLKLKQNSPRASDFSNILNQPDVTKWVEEHHNYIHNQLKQAEEREVGDVELSKEAPKVSKKRGQKRTQTEKRDTDEIKTENETVDQSPQIRTTRRHKVAQQIQQEDVNEPTQNKNTRSRRKQPIAEYVEQPAQELRATRSKRVLSVKQETAEETKFNDPEKSAPEEVEQPAQEVRATRSRRVLRVKQETIEETKGNGSAKSAPEIESTKSKRAPRNKKQSEQEQKNTSSRNARSSNNKENIENVKDVEDIKNSTPAKTRSLRGRKQVEEKDSPSNEVNQEPRTTRNRRQPKNKQQSEQSIPKCEEDIQDTTSTESRKLPTSKSHIEEEGSKNDEIVEAAEKTKNTARRRVPKSKEQIQKDNDVEHDNEDIQADEFLENKNKGTKTKTRNKKNIKHDIKNEVEDTESAKEIKVTRNRRQPKNEKASEAVKNEVNENEIGDVAHNEKSNRTQTKTSRSRKQPIKNEQILLVVDEHVELDLKAGKRQRENQEPSQNDDAEVERKSPTLLRTRKRKANTSEDAPTDLLKVTKKIVKFNIDSPRRSNRTPKKLHRIADEEFEYDVDKISTGHSKKSTRKDAEKEVAESSEVAAEQRKSKRARK